MTIQGYQFDRAKITAANDATLYNALRINNNSVISEKGNEMNVQTNGLDLIIETGAAIIYGRLVEIIASETISVPQNYNGWLVITIDLTQNNDSTGTPGNADYTFTNNQLKLEIVDSLTQDDLNNNGLVYNFILGQVSSDNQQVSFTRKDENYNFGLTFFGDDFIKVGANKAQDSNYFYGSKLYDWNWEASPATGYLDVIVKNEKPLSIIDGDNKNNKLELFPKEKTENFSGNFGMSFLNTRSRITFKRKGNVVIVEGRLNYNATRPGETNTIQLNIPEWALSSGTIVATGYNYTKRSAVGVELYTNGQLRIVHDGTSGNDTYTNFNITYYI